MEELPEARLQVLLIFLIFCSMDTLLWLLVLVGEGVSVQDTYVNTVRPSLLEVADQQVYLLLQMI